SGAGCPPHVDRPHLSVRDVRHRLRDLAVRSLGIRGLRMRRDRERGLQLETWRAARQRTADRDTGHWAPRTPTGNAPVSVLKNQVKTDLTGLLLQRKVPSLWLRSGHPWWPMWGRAFVRCVPQKALRRRR